MTANEATAQMQTIYDTCLCPLYRTLATRRLEVRAEARRSHSRAGYAELAALRAEITRYQNQIVELRIALIHAAEAA